MGSNSKDSAHKGSIHASSKASLRFTIQHLLIHFAPAGTYSVEIRAQIQKPNFLRLS